MISGKGRPEKGDKGRLPQPIRSSAGEISCPKGLDWDIPVTEVWTSGGIGKNANQPWNLDFRDEKGLARSASSHDDIPKRKTHPRM
jgi:hypothetical protein